MSDLGSNAPLSDTDMVDDSELSTSSSSDDDSDDEWQSGPSSQSLLTSLFAVTRMRSGMGPKAPQSPAHGSSSVSADERAEMQRIAREQAMRDHEAKKKYPKVSEVTWTHKDRKKRTVVQELTRLIRQLNDYLKVDAVRETAFEADDNRKAQLRAVRMTPLSIADSNLPPPGLRLDQHGQPVLDPNGFPNVANAKQYGAFQEANTVLVNCILDAVRDPTLNN